MRQEAAISKPVFEDLFRPAQRRDRLSFILYALTFCTVGAGLVVLMIVTVGGTQKTTGILGLLAYIAVYLAMCASGLFVAAQRCRDFGWTGWAALMILAPVVGWLFALALFFIPGTRGPNRYGPDPAATFTDMAHLPAE